MADLLNHVNIRDWFRRVHGAPDSGL